MNSIAWIHSSRGYGFQRTTKQRLNLPLPIVNFYLVRHGEAEPAAEDSRRPLTARGRNEVRNVAQAAASKGIKVSAILYSDKLRAKETAEILAQVVPSGSVRQSADLAPEDPPDGAWAELEAATDSLMLVGHLPHLSRLLSLLLHGDPERERFDLPVAALVCIARVQGEWELQWTLKAQRS